MKELEALRELQHELMQRHNDMYCDGGCDKQSLDIITQDVKEKFELIAKSLTPPTSDEVCKALSEYLCEKIGKKLEVEYLNGDFILINNYIAFLDGKGSLCFNFNLPPHLITLIGRFYEGMEKK